MNDEPLKPGDMLGPGLRYGGSLDDPDNPASPFVQREDVEELAEQIIGNLPPTRKQAEGIVAGWERSHRTALADWIRLEFIRKLTHGEPIPPLPDEPNHSPADWRVEPDSEQAKAHDAIRRHQLREHGALRIPPAVEVKLFDRYVREPFKRLLRR
jgi:hypothetical protein